MRSLIEILTLDEAGPDLFRGQSHKTTDGWFSIFGGQVIAQALSAASRTVAADRPVHSLHAYFVRAGRLAEPVFYQVHRDRDGGSFSSRRVVALQQDKPILTLSASFHAGGQGVRHNTLAMPCVPPPEDLPSLAEIEARQDPKHRIPMEGRMSRALTAVEVRPVIGGHLFTTEPGPATGLMWFRLAEAATDDPAMHRILLSYASDLALIATAIRPHQAQMRRDGQAASLDHAVWFHAPFRADEWMLYAKNSPWADDGRALCEGRIFARDGRLIATVVQEGFVKLGDGAPV